MVTINGSFRARALTESINRRAAELSDARSYLVTIRLILFSEQLTNDVRWPLLFRVQLSTESSRLNA